MSLVNYVSKLIQSISKKMKQFKNYQVTLHDRQKHAKIMKVRTCVSKSAALTVANYLDKMNGASNPYWASMAYELDAKGLPIFN